MYQNIFIKFSFFLLLISCGKDTYLEAQNPNQQKGRIFVNALNEELTSSSFSYLDDNIEKGGAWVFIIEKNTGRIYSIDLDTWNENSNIRSWLSTNLIETSNLNSPRLSKPTFIYEDNYDTQKDLEKIAEQINAKIVKKMTLRLIYEYAIPSDRAENIVGLSLAIRKIKKRRALKEDEINFYTKELVGVGYKRLKKSLEDHFNGKSQDFNAVIQKAAYINHTSPEAILDIFSIIYQ